MPKILTKAEARAAFRGLFPDGKQYPSPVRDALKEGSLASFENSKQRSLDSLSNLGKAAGALSYVSAMQATSDPMIGGISKIGLGTMIVTNGESIGKLVGAKLAPTVGALGGAVGIAGLAQMTSSVLPSYASMPLNAVGGYLYKIRRSVERKIRGRNGREN